MNSNDQHPPHLMKPTPGSSANPSQSETPQSHPTSLESTTPKHYKPLKLVSHLFRVHCKSTAWEMCHLPGAKTSARDERRCKGRDWRGKFNNSARPLLSHTESDCITPSISTAEMSPRATFVLSLPATSAQYPNVRKPRNFGVAVSQSPHCVEHCRIWWRQCRSLTKLMWRLFIPTRFEHNITTLSR